MMMMVEASIFPVNHPPTGTFYSRLWYSWVVPQDLGQLVGRVG